MNYGAQLGFYFSHAPTGTAGGLDYYDITGVQLEVGSSASDFQQEDFAYTLLKCQRFYCKTFQYSMVPAGGMGPSGSIAAVSVGTGIQTSIAARWQYPIVMRASPSIALFNTQFINTGWWDATANTTIASAGYVINDTAFTLGNNAATVNAHVHYIHMTADAEL